MKEKEAKVIYNKKSEKNYIAVVPTRDEKYDLFLTEGGSLKEYVCSVSSSKIKKLLEGKADLYENLKKEISKLSKKSKE